MNLSELTEGCYLIGRHFNIQIMKTTSGIISFRPYEHLEHIIDIVEKITKEHKGHSYFKHEDGSWHFCLLEGLYVCRQARAETLEMAMFVCVVDYLKMKDLEKMLPKPLFPTVEESIELLENVQRMYEEVNPVGGWQWVHDETKRQLKMFKSNSK